MATKTKIIAPTHVFRDHDMPIAVLRNVDHAVTPLHSHGFHELVLITCGSGNHTTSHGSFPLKRGDAFLIHGATQHGYSATEKLGLINIVFDPQQASLPLDTLDLGAVPGYHALFKIEPRLRQRGADGLRLGLNNAQLEQALAIVAELESELHVRRPGGRFMACGHLIRLIGFLSRCYSELHQTSRVVELEIGRVLSYIEEHLSEALTIDDLARVAGMAPATFMRRFRHAVGGSPLDYTIRRRIARVCERLRQGDDQKLAVIAAACGFSDANYFSRTFKRIMGCTPRAYRAAR